MSVVIRAHFDGKTIVPDEPVDLPVNQPLEFEFRPSDKRAERRRAAREAWESFTADPIAGLRISDESLCRANLVRGPPVSYLVDTNVFLRSRDAGSPLRDMCTRVVRQLIDSDEDIYVCTQVLAEYWVVATRPITDNGMGLGTDVAAAEIDKILSVFDSLAEAEDGSRRWRDLVARYRVVGKKAHDARLAALMLAHGVTHILTLNTSDFARYQGVTAVSPAELPQ